MKNHLILATVASTFFGVTPFIDSNALALTTTFSSDPFAGSAALTTPGRQAVGTNEIQLPSFNVATDVFAFDRSVPAYSAVGSLNFYNGLISGVTPGANVIVLQDTDNDANPATPFNAGTAASLIASILPDTTVTPGFFIYWNSTLSVNRLVYSTDLTVPSADISILARILSPTGQAAINTLPTFTSSNFTAVPFENEPTLGLVILGVAYIVRRRLKFLAKK
jgi:hypothetical protein